MNNIKISHKNVYKILICLSFLITVVTVLYSRFTNTDGVILKEDLTVNFREEVYIKDFIMYLDGKLIDNYLVDTSEVGLKDVIITYKNEYGFIVGKKITIEVKDVVSPTVVVSNPYVIEKGTIDNLEETIFCADDYDDAISCNIKGEYDLNSIGNYDLEIVATDNSGNITNKKFILKIIEKQIDTDQNTTVRYTKFSSIYDKYKDENTEVGLDISKWQGEVNYEKLKQQGVDFVMLKIGGQNEINGEYNIDPRFYDNIEGAILNDIKVGIYFYSYANDEKEAVKQADWIVDKLEDYRIDLPIVFDWENWSKYTKFRISFHTLNKVATAFMDRVDELGYEGVLYSSKYYLENIWYQEDYTNWLAYYNEDFTSYKDYYMWQLCNNGKIDGIDSYVDIDIRYKGKKDV